MTAVSSLRRRVTCAGTHLFFSAIIAVGVAIVVFRGWYPDPYSQISGGLHLFFILILVDLTLGPLATAVVSGPHKSTREWRTDVSLIVLLQVGALGYGLWTIHQARPVYMAFEIDRFRVVHAVDVDPELLARAPDRLQALPQWGPRLVAIRPFVDAAEKAEATLAAIQGVELGFRSDLWVPIENVSPALRAALNPVAHLLEKYPLQATELARWIDQRAIERQQLGYLPLHSKNRIWTVVIDRTSLEPVLYLPIDPYE